MTRQEAEIIAGMLRSFDRLDRKATDEEGWVALKLSCSRAMARRRIAAARKILGLEEKPGDAP